MDPVQVVFASVAVFIGACIQGAVGFGFGTFAAPLLVIVDRELVPGPLLFLGLMITTLVARRERAALDLHGVRWALVGRFPGAAIGALGVAVLSEHGLAIAFAVAVLLAVALSLTGWRVRRTTASLLVAGVISGMMGTATSIGGPPIALVYQDTRGAALRGTLAGYFMIGAAVSLVGLAIFGEFGFHEAGVALLLVPAMVAGFIVSRYAALRLDRGWTRSVVLGLSAASCSVILLQELL